MYFKVRPRLSVVLIVTALNCLLNDGWGTYVAAVAYAAKGKA